MPRVPKREQATGKCTMALKELSLVEIQVMFGSNCGSELEDPANYHRQTYKIMTTCIVPVPSKNGARGDGCPEDERHPTR